MINLIRRQYVWADEKLEENPDLNKEDWHYFRSGIGRFRLSISLEFLPLSQWSVKELGCLFWRKGVFIRLPTIDIELRYWVSKFYSEFTTFQDTWKRKGRGS